MKYRSLGFQFLDLNYTYQLGQDFGGYKYFGDRRAVPFFNYDAIYNETPDPSAETTGTNPNFQPLWIRKTQAVDSIVKAWINTNYPSSENYNNINIDLAETCENLIWYLNDVYQVQTDILNANIKLGNDTSRIKGLRDNAYRWLLIYQKNLAHYYAYKPVVWGPKINGSDADFNGQRRSIVEFETTGRVTDRFNGFTSVIIVGLNADPELKAGGQKEGLAITCLENLRTYLRLGLGSNTDAAREGRIYQQIDRVNRTLFTYYSQPVLAVVHNSFADFYQANVRLVESIPTGDEAAHTRVLNQLLRLRNATSLGVTYWKTQPNQRGTGGTFNPNVGSTNNQVSEGMNHLVYMVNGLRGRSLQNVTDLEPANNFSDSSSFIQEKIIKIRAYFTKERENCCYTSEPSISRVSAGSGAMINEYWAITCAHTLWNAGEGFVFGADAFSKKGFAEPARVTELSKLVLNSGYRVAAGLQGVLPPGIQSASVYNYDLALVGARPVTRFETFTGKFLKFAAFIPNPESVNSSYFAGVTYTYESYSYALGDMNTFVFRRTDSRNLPMVYPDRPEARNLYWGGDFPVVLPQQNNVEPGCSGGPLLVNRRVFDQFYSKYIVGVLVSSFAPNAGRPERWITFKTFNLRDYDFIDEYATLWGGWVPLAPDNFSSKNLYVNPLPR